MNATDRERVGPMLNPPQLGELIREIMEAVGWGTADHWMRMQGSYELAQVRRERAPAGRPDAAQKVVAVARYSSELSDEEAMAAAVRETRRHRAGQDD